ncbi:Proline-rich receptor-like protein kinase PERK13 [Acorus calamus]|uniref:non-specific serine/threonine protein kinase n=1 Tax=Acorus calamus TaxID=4465 RepID=A0AAV9DJS4_ACOCL|nr:Proline-rich receptor-like protein kinase PERK13 [Acorus calamus]
MLNSTSSSTPSNGTSNGSPPTPTNQTSSSPPGGSGSSPPSPVSPPPSPPSDPPSESPNDGESPPPEPTPSASPPPSPPSNVSPPPTSQPSNKPPPPSPPPLKQSPPSSNSPPSPPPSPLPSPPPMDLSPPPDSTSNPPSSSSPPTDNPPEQSPPSQPKTPPTPPPAGGSKSPPSSDSPPENPTPSSTPPSQITPSKSPTPEGSSGERSPSRVPQLTPPPSKHSGSSPSSHSGSGSLRSPSDGSSGGFGNGAVVGVTLAGVVVVLIAMFFVIRRKRKRRADGLVSHYRPPPGNFPMKTNDYYYGQVNTTGNSARSDTFNYAVKPPPSPSALGNSYMNGSHRGYQSGGPDTGGIGGSKSWFSYEELMEITDGFSKQNLLGEGGFGCVYKGWLPDGKEVAVKQLKAGSGQGEREFRAEVEIISRVHHRHLVSLVGYCIAEHHRLLVYEFLPNNTLEYHLHDFGLAKLSNDLNTHVSTRVMGTFGYMAPEYASSGKLTDRSDVFSFGVVLLEIITGRKPVDASQPLGDESLVEWARPLLNQALDTGDFSVVVDPRLENNYVKSEMFRMMETAAACVRHSAPKRPRMVQVVRALDTEGEMADITNGVKFGQSAIFEAGQYASEIQRFRRMAFGSAGQSSEFGFSGEYDQRNSSYSGEFRSREMHGRPPHPSRGGNDSAEFQNDSDTQPMYRHSEEARSNYGNHRF